MPAPHHSVYYRLDALPAAQPTASKHRRHLNISYNMKIKLFHSSAIKSSQPFKPKQHSQKFIHQPAYYRLSICER